MISANPCFTFYNHLSGREDWESVVYAAYCCSVPSSVGNQHSCDGAEKGKNRLGKIYWSDVLGKLKLLITMTLRMKSRRWMKWSQNTVKQPRCRLARDIIRRKIGLSTASRCGLGKTLFLWRRRKRRRNGKIPVPDRWYSLAIRGITALANLNEIFVTRQWRSLWRLFCKSEVNELISVRGCWVKSWIRQSSSVLVAWTGLLIINDRTVQYSIWLDRTNRREVRRYDVSSLFPVAWMRCSRQWSHRSTLRKNFILVDCVCKLTLGWEFCWALFLCDFRRR